MARLSECREHRNRLRPAALALIATILVLSAMPLPAQAPLTFRYFYNDRGQLQKAADSTGTVIEYAYDSAGNIVEVKQSTASAGQLTLFSFSPAQGAPLA